MYTGARYLRKVVIDEAMFRGINYCVNRRLGEVRGDGGPCGICEKSMGFGLQLVGEDVCGFGGEVERG